MTTRPTSTKGHHVTSLPRSAATTPKALAQQGQQASFQILHCPKAAGTYQPEEVVVLLVLPHSATTPRAQAQQLTFQIRHCPDLLTKTAATHRPEEVAVLLVLLLLKKPSGIQQWHAIAVQEEHLPGGRSRHSRAFEL